MVDYQYPEHHCDSAEDAIELAQRLHDSGKYDLFRGQRHTFPIIPSIARPDVDGDVATERLNSFASWVTNTPDLKSLHGHADAILAVAQHYGIKTPLMDVSLSPRVAGFFATDGGKAGDTGTIICLKRESFVTSWQDLNNRYAESSGSTLTDIIEIDVRNLWRLKAQQGLFIRSHVDANVFEMFSHVLHIYFPQRPDTHIIDRDAIYPKEKSHLEVMLDQYFLVETYDARNAKLASMFGNVVTVNQSLMDNEIASYFFNDSIPAVHSSWASDSIAAWFAEPAEPLPVYGSRRKAKLLVPTSSKTEDLEAQIAAYLMEARGSPLDVRGHIDWTVEYQTGETAYYSGEGISPKKVPGTEFTVSEMVNVIYAGMRYLPFTDKQVSRSIARYLAMVTFGCYETIEDAEGVEFSGGEIRGRGFCSKAGIRESVRGDFYKLVKPEKLDHGSAMSMRDLLFATSSVRSCYEFEKFVQLFVEDLIPSQAVIAVEGLVIGLNPARIDVFGES